MLMRDFLPSDAIRHDIFEALCPSESELTQASLRLLRPGTVQSKQNPEFWVRPLIIFVCKLLIDNTATDQKVLQELQSQAPCMCCIQFTRFIQLLSLPLQFLSLCVEFTVLDSIVDHLCFRHHALSALIPSQRGCSSILE